MTIKQYAIGGVLTLLALPVLADMSVAVGPTKIPRGDAQGANDITVSNNLFAVAFAVDTAPPWGVARGGIVDIAIIKDGVPGYDIASLADFMPNNWSSWPTSYQCVTIEKNTPEEVVIKTQRDWGDVELESLFRIMDGEPKVNIVTRMTNKGVSVLTDIRSGYVVWPDGGYLFGVPGMPGIKASDETAAVADWSAAYDEGWALGLHAPFADYVDYAGRDRYLTHSLKPGESRTIEGWVQIEGSGNLALMVASEIAFKGLNYGTLYGQVMTAAGSLVASPAVVVYKGDVPYTWAIGEAGRYSFVLPVGEYSVYATAAGFSQGVTSTITINDGAKLEHNFDDIEPPGELVIQVVDKGSNTPMDARISIEQGPKPLIEFQGKKVFFTELGNIGELAVPIAPGNYTFRIASSDGFTSRAGLVELTVKSGEKNVLQAALTVEARPSAQGWYSADLHHHSDVLDGFSSPEQVIRSELAAGLDIAFLSDHDSVVNNKGMQQLAATRGHYFIPATELSPSWGHFNAYPLDDGKVVEIEPGTATVQQIFGEARRMGADVVSVNHPYLGNYGYFKNLEQPGVVPGGYDAGFDLVEIHAGENHETAERTWQLWNEGHDAYFVAGSDVHDVLHEISGAARSYVHVNGELTIGKFIESLKKGRSFASQGPLVFPEVMFGSELQHHSGSALSLNYSLRAVNGLRSVQLIERGIEVQRSDYAGETASTPLKFTVHPLVDTWYSLVIVDAKNRRTYTNPVWVDLID